MYGIQEKQKKYLDGKIYSDVVPELKRTCGKTQKAERKSKISGIYPRIYLNPKYPNTRTVSRSSN